MYLQDFIGDKDAVLTETMRHPALSPKRKPTVDQALKACVSTIEMMVAVRVTDQVQPLLQDMYDMYEIDNGEYESIDVESRDEWESGLDDQVEKILGPYEKMLSADWLGLNTVDTRLYEENAIPKLAQSTGKEVFKQLAYGKTPAQVLSNAGIVPEDIELYLSQHLGPKTAEQEQAMAEETDNEIGAVLSKVRGHVGDGFDPMEIYGDFELAVDDDDILAMGAGKRLGLDENDVEQLRLFALDHDSPEDAANALVSMLDDAKGAKPAKAAKAKKADKPAPATNAAGGELDANSILAALKDHSAVKDTEIATELGVSRATYNNWTSGKSSFKPDDGQLATLRNRLVADVNGLYAALCAIDGTDVDRTFE